MENGKDIDEIARELAHGLSLDELRRQQSGEVLANEAHGPTPEQVAAELKYWQTVFADRPKCEALPIRKISQEMEYEAARRKFWAILQFRAAVIEVSRNEPFDWIFGDPPEHLHVSVIQNLIKYFINDPTIENPTDAGKGFPLTKGLFLYGEPGTGKTEILESFQKLCEQERLSKQFEWTSMSRLYETAKTDKDFNPIAEPVTMNRALDEFGRYTGGVIRFGDSLDINEAVVEQRYERFMRYGQFSFFIANATPNELQGKFTPMVLDRLRAMCTGVLFTGKSKRK